MNSTPQGNLVVSNRKFIDNDTSEIVDKYIDEICSNPEFLCTNIELCGNNTSIYANVENVRNICDNIKEANICENDVKECIVLAENTFDESQKYVSTSFVNIIIPIKNGLDDEGNQKFIRLPPLSGSKKKNSNEVCNVCACMDRFARSPGSGFNDYTSPGQNACVYGDDFEYYYYPLYVEEIRNKLKNAPIITIGGKYKIINSNIIHVNTEDDLSSCNLYNLLIKNGISKNVILNFINNILYKDDKQASKELNLCLLNKEDEQKLKYLENKSFKKMSFFYIVFIAFLIIMLINLRK
jgi:hypothetical protein